MEKVCLHTQHVEVFSDEFYDAPDDRSILVFTVFSGLRTTHLTHTSLSHNSNQFITFATEYEFNDSSNLCSPYSYTNWHRISRSKDGTVKNLVMDSSDLEDELAPIFKPMKSTTRATAIRAHEKMKRQVREIIGEKKSSDKGYDHDGVEFWSKVKDDWIY